MTKPAHTFSLLGGLWVIAGAGSVDNLFEPDLCLHSRVVGGSQLIAIRLAERLGERVVLDAPVRTCRWSDGCGDPGGERATLSRRASVIVAIPPNLTGGIRFEPALPAWRMRAEQSVSQGSVIKVLAVYDHPFWREDGLVRRGVRLVPVRARGVRQLTAERRARRAGELPPRRDAARRPSA